MYSQNKVDKKTHEAELLTKLCDKQIVKAIQEKKTFSKTDINVRQSANNNFILTIIYIF